MKDCKKVKLGEICEIIGGGTPSTKIPEYWNGDIPWISSSDLKENDVFNINIK
ncbi:MAG: restriction endonuclease subunit S, partial [Ruminococcus sp.]|nr:restriction endonuclease subunit S [Ruminococcus sp.]